MAQYLVVTLDLGHAFGRQRTIPCRDDIVRGALENDELLGVLRDMRDTLHRRRARTDDADAQSGEVDTVSGPQGGVIRVTGEIVFARDFGGIGYR